MAPAGGFDCLQAAIQGGANSVYFGIGRLNMRSRSAANFLPEDLPEVVRICREAGVRSYLTLNITLFQDDLAAMHEALDAARAAGVDAVIASSWVVLTVFSHGRLSAPGWAGFSDENRYWKVVSRPIWWRISLTAPSATALTMEFDTSPVRPSLQPLKRPT